MRTEEASQVFPRELADWGCGGRRDGPHQVIIEETARALRAPALELGDGAEPGAGSIADGLGLGKGLVALAAEALVRSAPHRAARILQPAGIRELGVGAAPHLRPREASRHGQHSSARDGVDALQTHLVQLVHFLEPCSLGALPGRPAHDGAKGRRDGPDQIVIVSAARVCRAAGLELGDGAEPGAWD